MKARELREKTDAELEQSLADFRREIFDIGMKASTGQMEKAARARQVRRDIARILTILNERNKKTEDR
jgi:large subunit ribosomal protein L29